MNENRLKLRNLEIRGFKSIPSQGQNVSFGDVTILLGANGSGKSNLVSFFKLLNSATHKSLQLFIGKQGGADALLYYGSKHTEKLEFSVSLVQSENNEINKITYDANLVHGLPDRLFFASETITVQAADTIQSHKYFIDAGNGESGLADDLRPTTKILFSALADIWAYQFHDTSDTAKIKTVGFIDDSRYLRSDAGNLAAFLRVMLISQNNKKYYERIVRHIQKVMPQFKDFELEPMLENDNYVRLNWRDTSGEMLFGPHQISDGSLRFMALAALLLQPITTLPKVIIIDEPELGLHPAAVTELAGMIKTASKYAQIIIGTQSTQLLDEFSASDIVVVERDENSHSSVFKRLKEIELKEWLSRYTLSELWEKNVLGGRP